VSATSQIARNVKLVGTYRQVEENLVRTGSKTNLAGPFGISQTENRGDDTRSSLPAEITPFRGLTSAMFRSSTLRHDQRQRAAGSGGSQHNHAFTNPDGSRMAA